MERFSDFAEKRHFDGDKISLEEILNQEITIFRFRVQSSKKREDSQYATIQIEVHGEKRIVFTGSSVIIEQLEKYRDRMPFLTTIKRINKFFTLT